MNGKQQTKKMKSVDDDNSDVEKNFTLLTERRGRGETEEEQRHNRGEDEEEFSDEGKEEESGEEEESDGGEEDEDDDEEEPDDVGGSKIQTREDIKKELSNMSFEDVMKLQNKVGTKVYNEVTYGNSKKPKSGKKKRLNKNRPMEISAKKPAPFLRRVVAIRKPTLRDPRFDDLSGEYKPEIFEKTYKFIDNIKQREKEVVQKQLKRKKMSNEKKEKLQFLLKRMENQERARKSREQQRERELQFKRQQRERANQGAQPFFLKKSEKKKLQLAEKYQELKKSGKLQNFLSKKRKRNAGKDRRKLPPHNAKTS
ncbi:ribosomal RNA processing protein 36 homolog isoform X2 [Hippoglossus hippoglossus]|uniref:ribosomal RNA processing protein 36 homolog isoform X2 n=1 Tax=Hippoglossus hippoglossus TaxID=8267 RepID=UPI00148BC756|nr:ribosomal RNA processing protein 36 homolog isoform X2 [Hippoglossus hippoglossus]